MVAYGEVGEAGEVVTGVGWREIPRIVDVLAEAYAADPLLHGLWPWGLWRERMLYLGLTRETQDAWLKGAVLRTRCGGGVLLWSPGRAPRTSWPIAVFWAPIGLLDLAVTTLAGRSLLRMIRQVRWEWRTRPRTSWRLERGRRVGARDWGRSSCERWWSPSSWAMRREPKAL